MSIKDGERIAVMEHQVSELVDDVKNINAKLDQLLELKAKGMGAVQLATLIIGSGVIGIVSSLIMWIKG
jgi:hypothetical protein